jgi:hypothetical protein
MVWHDADWSINFIDRFARPRRHLGLRIVNKVDRANQRFGQVNRVVGDRGDGQWRMMWALAVARSLRGTPLSPSQFSFR